MILDAAPVAAVERVAADEVQRPGDRAAVAFGEHQQHVVAHRRWTSSKKRAGQVGRAPFAAAGVLIEAPEGVPVLRARSASPVRARMVPPKRLRDGALLADRLALARGEVGEEGVEIGVAAVLPVELLGGAVQQAHRLAPVRASSSVQKVTCSRGEAIVPRELISASDQRGAARRPRCPGGSGSAARSPG